MKSAIILCVMAVAAVALARPDSPTTYTNKYDNINIEEILSKPKIVKAYGNCMLGDGPCTPEGKELKSNMKEALETECAKCTPAQRKGSERVIEHCIKNEPELWEKLKAKFDPTGKYAKKYEDRLKAITA